MQLSGTYTALVTPFRGDEDRTIDWEALEALVEAQVEGGVEGLVPCGTTGESPALTEDEHVEVVRRVVRAARGRVRVVAGTGASSTRHAVALGRAAERAGVDGVMIVVPYYNRPSQDGLVEHFVAAAAAAPVPVVVYNVPARTGSDLTTDALARICERAPNVVGVKEATGNVTRAQEIGRRFGDRLTVMSGDDALTLPMIAVGAKGVISVTSNVLPAAVARATRLALNGAWEEARRAHFDLLPVHEAMLCEANPGPAKAALAARGRLVEVVRGPLVPASERAREAVRAALAAYEGRA